MAFLQGVRTIVTGAGSGIGRAVVLRYLREGAQVIAVIRDPAQAKALAELGAVPVVGDVSQYSTASEAVAMAERHFGGLDVFVANAGLWDFHKRLEKQSPEQLAAAANEIFGTNIMATIFAAKAAIGPLRASKGMIIATGSNASYLAGGGGCLYTASKFALRGLIMQLAKELAPDIRVNGIAPGATDTGLSGPQALGQADKEMNGDPARLDAMTSHIPLGFVSTPEDHTGLYVLLASRTDAKYVTGAMLVSDGGLTISA